MIISFVWKCNLETTFNFHVPDAAFHNVHTTSLREEWEQLNRRIFWREEMEQ